MIKLNLFLSKSQLIQLVKARSFGTVHGYNDIPYILTKASTNQKSSTRSSVFAFCFNYFDVFVYERMEGDYLSDF